MTMPAATEDETVAEPAQQEDCAERPRRPPHLRGGHNVRQPRPLPDARASIRGQGCQRRRKLPTPTDGDAGLGARVASGQR